MSEIKAVNNFVFILRDKPEKDKAGMFIPSRGIEKQHKGKIISVGQLAKDPNIKAGKGKTAMFFKGIGFELPYEDETYLVLLDSEIIAIL